MSEEKRVLDRLISKVQDRGDVDVLWLYGSRVKGLALDTSDFDLAVAFKAEHTSSSPYLLDELSESWSCELGQRISLVNINKIPTPLAYSVISEGKILFCCNSLRLHSEQMRIWSRWELYRHEHLKNRA